MGERRDCDEPGLVLIQSLYRVREDVRPRLMVLLVDVLLLAQCLSFSRHRPALGVSVMGACANQRLWI